MSNRTLNVIVSSVKAAVAAERANESAFVEELANANTRNVSYFLNAMSVCKLGSISVFLDFLKKYTNFDIGFTKSISGTVKVDVNGNIIKKADATNGIEYDTWFEEKLMDEDCLDEATMVRFSTLYVCNGFKKKPVVKEDATAAVRAESEKRVEQYNYKVELWNKFKAGEDINVLVGTDEDGVEVYRTIRGTDYNRSIVSFMNLVATNTRSHKISVTKATKDEAQKRQEAYAKMMKAMEAYNALAGDNGVKLVSIQKLDEMANAKADAMGLEGVERDAFIQGFVNI